MPHRFQSIDPLTPPNGTALSEWMRQADLAGNGATLHNLRNVAAALIGIRYEASGDWTPQRVENDMSCERQLRLIIRDLNRERLSYCNVTHQLVPAMWAAA